MGAPDNTRVLANFKKTLLVWENNKIQRCKWDAPSYNNNHLGMITETVQFLDWWMCYHWYYHKHSQQWYTDKQILA